MGTHPGFYTAENYEKVCEKVCEILHYEGAGHTFSMHTNDDKMVDYFARRVPASRVMVNTPSALGGIGGTTALQPALTLGCGAVGGSATSENVGPMHLLNLRYVACGLGAGRDPRLRAGSLRRRLPHGSLSGEHRCGRHRPPDHR